MEVKIKKIHSAWNNLYEGEFNIGDTVQLKNDIVTTKSGRKFNGKDLCNSISNICTYSDIFYKI